MQRFISHDRQREIDEYFTATSSYWGKFYQGSGLISEIYWARQQAALRWVDERALSHTEKILDAGCGPGITTVALARRGYQVVAVDSVQAMLNRTLQRASSAGVGPLVRAKLADVHALDFEEKTFSLVLALGLLPWLHSPAVAVRELARVLKSGGQLIITADNRWRLSSTLDPRLNDGLRFVRRALGRAFGLPLRNYAKMHSIRQVDSMIASARLEKIRSRTIGFGPFSMLGINLPESMGLRLHRALQRAADRNVPLLRNAGSHYVVLAMKY